MKTPHKHAELIKAWADGELIEKCVGPDEWWDDPNPEWHPLVSYRLKPEPKPDVVVQWLVEENRVTYFDNNPKSTNNLQLTFDGETGKLKSAEVL